MGGDRLMEKWMASKARWIEEEQTRRVSNLRKRWWDADGEHFERVAVLDTALAMSIDDFGQRNEAMSTLDRQVKEAIARERRGSGGRDCSSSERHTRTSNAFAIYIMTLIGVGVANRRHAGDGHPHPHRRGHWLRVRLQRQTDFRLGHSCWCSTVVAAWTPNVLFGLFGIVLYRKPQVRGRDSNRSEIAPSRSGIQTAGRLPNPGEGSPEESEHGRPAAAHVGKRGSSFAQDVQASPMAG